MRVAIATLNQMDQDEFVGVLGEIFEQTPSIAREVWFQRPFQDGDDLHKKMAQIVQNFEAPAQLALIRAHPDLGSRLKMAEASVKEQAGVGLDRLSAEEYDQFQSLNQAYKDKFAFPFIIAVRNHTKASILEAFHRRLQNGLETEQQQAIVEIIQIARFRLMDLLKP
ncbi:MAG: 2-oxo-4-hydroxy-4-carboxy-5-ureidoimidazoline decarboxylase [Leptolyngbyaceae cyanobacterium bins.59]|nr:2-oxo-4-hydroxy-4-carboxy-5-ureidoimidazoline decarboxylase [Leptolyngbyaceae cyanobacterium bins.59]